MASMPKHAALALSALTLSLAACSVQSTEGSSGTSASSAAGSSATTGVSQKITGPDSVTPGDTTKPLSIAFSGFAKANSFTAAVYKGAEDYAKAHNATATFLDPNFDAQAQVSQIQDAVTSNRYDVFVVMANDGTAVVPALESAIAAGKKVVVLMAPVGTRYDTGDPQLPGAINIVDPPTDNGKLLGQLAAEACKKSAATPCKVAYLEGFKSLPLDNARTDAVKATLAAAGAEVVMSIEGGYTNDQGRKAMQDVLQAHPDVNVVIGSSQAIAGAASVAGTDSKILFVANGGSRQALEAVKDGSWFATVCAPTVQAGATAAAVGLAAARGQQVPVATAFEDLSPVGGLCNAANVAKVQGEYDE